MAERDEIVSIARAAVEEYIKKSEGDVTKGNISEEDLLKELNKYIKTIEKTVTDQARRNIQDNKDRKELIKNLQSNVVKRLEEQGVISKPSFWEKIGFKEPSKDDLATQYRARQMAGGIESIMEGRFVSGLRQIGSTIPQIANFMGGPLYLALSLTVKGLIAFDKHLAQLNKTVVSTTGGIYSDYLNKSYSDRLSYSKTIEDLARQYHRQGEKDEMMRAIQSNFAPVTAYDIQRGGSIAAAAFANRTAFEGIGIEKTFADQLLFKLMRQQGLTAGGASGQLNNLLRFASSKERGGIYSDQELIKKTDEAYNLMKMFGISMEWASRYVNKFSKEIELGTVAMSDFASYNRGIREGDTGKLAGIGQLLVEHGQAMGLNIPKEMLESSGNSLAMAWNLRKLAESGNKDLLKLLSSWIGTQTGNIAGSNEAAAMETLYSLVGPQLGFGKISQPQVEKIVKGGFKNLEGVYAVSGTTQPIEDFNNYKNLIDHYINKTTSETTKLTTAIGMVVSDLHKLFAGNKRIPVYIDGQEINTQTTGADVKRYLEQKENVIMGPTRVS